MKNNNQRIAAVIEAVARKEGKSPAEVRQAMQEAIDAAWTDPACRTMQQLLFPAGKPTVEEFLLQTAQELRSS